MNPTLKAWIETNVPDLVIGSARRTRGQFGQRVAEEAWEAATKHTLSFVAAELRFKARHLTGSECRESRWLTDLADDIMRMKP